MYIGIDLGGTNLKTGVVDENGKIVYQHTQATNAAKGLDYVLNNLKRLIYNLINKFPDVKSIGVGVPGILGSDGSVKISPNLPEWIDVPIGRFLGNVFSIPSVVDNDANVAAFAEMQLGEGKDLKNFIYVTLGTGAGGSIVINQQIYRGESLGAGEIGHMIIDVNAVPDFDQPYRTGVLEKFIGRNQITALGYEVLKSYPKSILKKFDRPDPYFVSEALNKGNDEAAELIFTKVGTYLGIALSSAMNLLDIGVVIIGGGISQAHPLLKDVTLKTIKLRALPTIAERAEVRIAKFTKDAGIIGAALMGAESVS